MGNKIFEETIFKIVVCLKNYVSLFTRADTNHKMITCNEFINNNQNKCTLDNKEKQKSYKQCDRCDWCECLNYMVFKREKIHNTIYDLCQYSVQLIIQNRNFKAFESFIVCSKVADQTCTC